jgi:tryptophanyl-tRNA synthetase
MSKPAERVVFSGVQPTSDSLHLGNALGAVAQWAGLQDEFDAYFCVVDLHSITLPQDPATLRRRTLATAAQYLAMGVDPFRATIFVQSHVPAHTELTWVLGCFTGFGQASRMTQFKDKSQKEGSDATTVGLFTYPVLMAADILLFDTDRVPVGKDQVQHIEIARDIALRVNHLYGEVLTLPEAHTSDNVAIVPGLDGRKMSKSYDNVIGLFLPPKQLRKVINRIVTDSTPPEAPKDPESSHIFQIYRAVASEEQARALAERYRSGIGWGEAKAALFDVLDAALGPARERYTALMADTAQIDRILADGAARARVIARATLSRVRAAIGVGVPG